MNGRCGICVLSVCLASAGVWTGSVRAAVPDSPFGFHPAGVFEPGYADSGFMDAQNIGVAWARQGVYAFWFLIQPDLNQPVYDFTLYDQQWSAVPEGLSILANISPDPQGDGDRTMPGSWIPVDIPKYNAFVRATVERYDGDGQSDMPGLLNPIQYWQVGNEPNEQITSNFAALQQITYEAIKAACADCTVLIGGVPGSPQGYLFNFDARFSPILAQLAGQYVDVFDFHWYGTASGDYRLADIPTGQDVYQHIRDTLAADGFPADLPIWITEMGSYSGEPAGPVPGLILPAQTERLQAGDHFKRFVYSLSRGVGKVFPAFGLVEGFLHNDGYFDHTGIIYDGQDSGDLGLGVKKLSYYTYKKMTEKLAGADWPTMTLLRDGTGTDHLYLVRVMKGGQPVLAAWWDYFDEPGYIPGDTKNITITGLGGTSAISTIVVPSATIGRDVTDYATAFSVTGYPIVADQLTIPLGEDPVIIEVTGSPAIPTVSEWGMVFMTLTLLFAGSMLIRRLGDGPTPLCGEE